MEASNVRTPYRDETSVFLSFVFDHALEMASKTFVKSGAAPSCVSPGGRGEVGVRVFAFDVVEARKTAMSSRRWLAVMGVLDMVSKAEVKSTR
jgi:hypothetical protein